MYNSQLLKILKSLSKTERRDFAKFLASPYYNVRPEVTQLFEFINTAIATATPSVLSKENLFAAVQPKQKYNDALMRQWIHHIFKILKRYFVEKELEMQKTEFQLILAKAIKRRGFDDFFERELDNVALINNEQPLRDAAFYFKNYQIEYEKLEHITLSRRKGEMPIKELTNALTAFYAIEVLRYSSTALYYKATFDVPLVENILNWVEKEQLVTSNEADSVHKASHGEGVALAIYYNIYMALKTNQTEYFDTLKPMIKQNWQLFSEHEGRVIYLLAINFCIRRINANEAQYLHEFFELMQSGLENKRLFENGILSKFTYKNIVTAALKLEKLTWVRSFIDEYKEYLHPKDREISYNFNLAVYYFRTGDFKSAMPLLQQVDFGDTYTNLDARSMLLRIYYDTEEFDALNSLLDSFQTFINRVKDINYLKESYSNLIKIVRRILRSGFLNTEIKTSILTEINEKQYLAERDWLVEKLQ